MRLASVSTVLAVLCEAPLLSAQPAPTGTPTAAPMASPTGLSAQPSLVAQLRWTVTAPHNGPSVVAPIELRRLRLGLRLSGLGGRLTGTLQLNTTPSALELLDMFAEYRVLPRLAIRAGLAKIPFTAYRMQSFTELNFVDWALVTRYFGGERQIGIELHDRLADASTEYAVGVYNGTTMRSAHGQGVGPVYGETFDNLSDLRSYHPPDAPHPEFAGRFAWHHGVHRSAGLSVAPAEGLGVDLGLSASVDLDPTPVHDFTAAFAPEVALRYGIWSFSSTGYLGLSPRTETSGNAALWGFLAEARVLIARRVGVALRYARVDRSSALINDARTRSIRLIYTGPDALRNGLEAQYSGAQHISFEQELTLGVNVYFIGRALVWQNDFGWLSTARDNGDRYDIRWRTQMQLAL